MSSREALGLGPLQPPGGSPGSFSLPFLLPATSFLCFSLPALTQNRAGKGFWKGSPASGLQRRT